MKNIWPPEVVQGSLYNRTDRALEKIHDHVCVFTCKLYGVSATGTVFENGVVFLLPDKMEAVDWNGTTKYPTPTVILSLRAMDEWKDGRITDLQYLYACLTRAPNSRHVKSSPVAWGLEDLPGIPEEEAGGRAAVDAKYPQKEEPNLDYIGRDYVD